MTDKENSRSRRVATERLALFGFGSLFVTALLILAFAIPDPTPFQYETFRTILALAAAGIATLMPGIIEFTLRPWLRAGGAMAVFATVYFFSPAQFIVDVKEPIAPTDQYEIYLIQDSGNFAGTCPQIRYELIRFPYSDVKQNASYSEFTSIVAAGASSIGFYFDSEESTIFRVRDEDVLRPDGDATATSDRNIGVLVVPNSYLANFDDNHLAFTCILSRVR